MSFVEKADGIYTKEESENLEKNFLDNSNKMSLRKLNDYFEDDKNSEFIQNDLVKTNREKILSSDLYVNKIGKIHGIGLKEIQYKLKEIGREVLIDFEKKGYKNELFESIFNIDNDGIFGKNTLKALLVFQKIMGFDKTINLGNGNKVDAGIKANGLINIFTIGYLFPEVFGNNKNIYNFDVKNKQNSINIVESQIKNKFTEYLINSESTKKETKRQTKELKKEVNKTSIENRGYNEIIDNKFFKENSKNIPAINYRNLISKLQDYGFSLADYNGEGYRSDVKQKIQQMQSAFGLEMTGIPDYYTIGLLFPEYFKTLNKSNYGISSPNKMIKYIKGKINPYSEGDSRNSIDLYRSKDFADYVLKYGAKTRTNMCGKGVGNTLEKYFSMKGLGDTLLPKTGRHGYKWEKFLDNNPNFTKVKVTDVRDVEPGGIMVYDTGYGPTKARRDYGHVEIKINNNKFFYGMFDSYPGGSVNAYKQKSGFTGYAYYLKS